MYIRAGREGEARGRWAVVAPSPEDHSSERAQSLVRTPGLHNKIPA